MQCNSCGVGSPTWHLCGLPDDTVINNVLLQILFRSCFGWCDVTPRQRKKKAQSIIGNELLYCERTTLSNPWAGSLDPLVAVLLTTCSVQTGQKSGETINDNEGPMTASSRVLLRPQGGTVEDDDINVAAFRADGAVLLAGWTDGSWHRANSGRRADFVAVLLDTGEAATTPPPTALELATTPSPIPLSTPSPIASTTLSSDAILTASPTTTSRGLPPTAPVSEPSQTLIMTLMPIRTAQPTALAAPAQSSAPSNAPAASNSSSGSSAGFDPIIVGAAVGVAASLAVIAVCILRHREAVGTVDSSAAASQEQARHPQSVSILPGSSASVSPPLLPPPYAEPPSYDVAIRST